MIKEADIVILVRFTFIKRTETKVRRTFDCLARRSEVVPCKIKEIRDREVLDLKNFFFD